MKNEIAKINKTKKEKERKSLEKARNSPKGQKCPINECNGRARVLYSYLSSRYKSGKNQGYVYLPGKCRIRKKKCQNCGHVFKTVEIPLARYQKEFILIHELKLAIKKFIT